MSDDINSLRNALNKKDIEIRLLKMEITMLKTDAERWRLLVKRYTCDLTSYPLIEELMKEAL